MEPLETKLHLILEHTPGKIVISKPRGKGSAYRKIEIERKEKNCLLSKYTEKQVFHENIRENNLFEFCLRYLKEDFLQLNAWDNASEYMLMLSKKGSVAFKSAKADKIPAVSSAHNRTKQYLIPEGTVVPPLVDMGIFTKDGKVVQSMYDKFKQINRFIELIDDAVQDWHGKELHIIDFGCGKSYLTFILYYYLTEVRGITADMTGLDLKKDVIEKCNLAAQKYGYSNLRFELGDINGYRCKTPVDMVISLHACDTATDYALYNAVTWGAKMIFSVPCCQHELNGQITGDALPILTHYGIVQERFSALATDAIRGRLLEACGYKTQLLEFVDLAHTPKNILIRAIKKNTRAESRNAALREVEALMHTFGFQPTLYRLLNLKANESESASAMR